MRKAKSSPGLRKRNRGKGIGKVLADKCFSAGTFCFGGFTLLKLLQECGPVSP